MDDQICCFTKSSNDANSVIPKRHGKFKYGSQQHINSPFLIITTIVIIRVEEIAWINNFNIIYLNLIFG